MFSTQSHEDLLRCPLPPRPTVVDRRWKPNVEIAPNCPRCNSSNTKFCYYNNYSLTQPRYFCKSCRRYWTKGGSLRNVPIGGGCRKNRRSRSVPVPTNRGGSSGGEQSGIGRSGVHVHQDGTNGNSHDHVMNSDASNIDLAVVYAKYLNQQPESGLGAGIHDLPREFDSSFDILSFSDTTPDTHVQFSTLDEQCIIRNDGIPDPSPEMFLGDMDLNYQEEERNLISAESTGYSLQPLENMPVQDMYWSDSPVVGPNFAWQTTLVNGFDPINISDTHSTTVANNCLDENWSSFDLSSFDAFTRP